MRGEGVGVGARGKGVDRGLKVRANIPLSLRDVDKCAARPTVSPASYQYNSPRARSDLTPPPHLPGLYPPGPCSLRDTFYLVFFSPRMLSVWLLDRPTYYDYLTSSLTCVFITFILDVMPFAWVYDVYYFCVPLMQKF